MKLVILLACLSYAAAKSNGQPFWFRPGIVNNLGSLLANHFNSGRRPNRPDSGLSQHTKPLRPAVSSVECGVQAIKPISSYIVGGVEAIEHSWPWMVSLQTRTGNHFCGGTLVRTNMPDNPYVVVTAAHCLGSQRINVALGVHDLYNNQGQVISVSQSYPHPNYKSQTLENDIAVLYLSKTPTINNNVSTVCIASRFYYTGEIATVTGWGTLSSGGSMPQRLQQVEKPIIDNNDCASAYRFYGYDTSTMMCAGLLSGGKDSCQGDSGGPLLTLRNGVYELTGVVSWGIGCADESYPGVYADVQKLKGFLNNHGIN